MANSHADVKKAKDFTSLPLTDQAFEERIKLLKTDADNWFERTVKISVKNPTPDDDTKAIASQYLAGLWELQNSQDKTKTPVNIKLAEAEALKWAASHTEKTATTGGSYATSYSSTLLNNIPGITDKDGDILSSL